MYRERKRERERERERGGETFILPLLNSHETVNREKCSDVAQLPKKSIESRRGFLSQHFALQYRPFYARRARALPSQNFYRERAANRNEANWIYAASLLQRNFPKKFATDRDRNEIPRQLFRTHYCASAKFSTSAPRNSSIKMLIPLSLSLSLSLCFSVLEYRSRIDSLRMTARARRISETVTRRGWFNVNSPKLDSQEYPNATRGNN